jgi:hypothetical protein
MARGVHLGPRSRVDPGGRMEGSLPRPTTRLKRHRGHRQGRAKRRARRGNP